MFLKFFISLGCYVLVHSALRALLAFALPGLPPVALILSKAALPVAALVQPVRLPTAALVPNLPRAAVLVQTILYYIWFFSQTF